MYRPTEMPVGTRAAHCTVCGEMFLSGDAFDIHRGIDKNLQSIGDYDDLRQDTGRCMTTEEMNKAGLLIWWDDIHSGTDPGRFGTHEDIALARKMAKARDNRN